MDPVRYRSFAFDSSRWAGFELRPGDIIISTPPKCGTTWTQMICALLVFQRPELDEPLASTSPWIDMVTRPRTEVFADLARQTHRRFVKTHTPLDGLPVDPSVTYLCVGRDPRDVARSMDHHRSNLDVDHLLRAREESARIDGVELEPLAGPPPRPDDPLERFWLWVDDDTDVTTSTSTLRFTINHLQTFRDAPADLDVVWLRYEDLLDDLEGQMRTLAHRLGIDVAPDRWDGLVRAATLAEMRRQADLTVPGASRDQWHDSASFFHRGSSGQWRDLLDDHDVERYAARVRSLADPDLVDWLHRPPLPPER
jgi:aryl sulfotransferase